MVRPVYSGKNLARSEFPDQIHTKKILIRQNPLSESESATQNNVTTPPVTCD